MVEFTYLPLGKDKEPKLVAGTLDEGGSVVVGFAEGPLQVVKIEHALKAAMNVITTVLAIWLVR